VNNGTLAAVTAAKAIGGPVRHGRVNSPPMMVSPSPSLHLPPSLSLTSQVHVLVAGKGCAEAAQSAARIKGVEKVLVADGDSVEHGGVAEVMTALLLAVQKDRSA
jgi:electron transfer flavoprotein alpha subunit